MTHTEVAQPGSPSPALIADMVGSLVNGDPLEQTLALICRKIRKLARFRFCGVLVPDSEWQHFRLAGGYGFPPEYIERLNELFLVPVGEQQRESPTRQAAEQKRTIVGADVLEVPEFVPWRSLALRFGYRSMVSIPLIVDGEVIGVLNGYSAERREFSDVELTSMEALADQAAVSLRVSLLMDERRETIRRLQETNRALHRQRVVLERAHEIHQRLTAAALAGASTGSVAQALSELVRHPVAITFADGRVRSTSDSADYPQAHGELLAVLEAARAAGGGERFDPAALRRTDGLAATVSEIRIPGELLGFVVIPHGDDSTADLDRRAAEHAATVIALDTVKDRMVQATEERLRSDFLSDLMRGRLDDDADVAERAARHGLRLGRPHRVVIARIDDPDASPPSPGVPATGDGLAQIRRELQRIPGTLVSSTGTGITAVVPADDETGSPASIRARLQAVQAKLRGIRPQLSVTAGIGAATSRVADFATSYRDAELCLDLGPRLRKTDLIVARDELGLLGLFIDAKNPDELTAHAREVLGPVIAHDAEKGADLLATLSTYLDHGCDVPACAADLYVHPNTVKYRLRQIESLCGLALRDPEDLLRARIATLTLALL